MRDMSNSPGVPLVGPSRKQNAKTKQKQNKKIGMRPVKHKKLVEKQMLDVLEHNVMNFVSLLSSWTRAFLIIQRSIFQEPPEDLKSFADLPLSEPTKRGESFCSAVTESYPKRFRFRVEKSLFHRDDRYSGCQPTCISEGKRCPRSGAHGEWENSGFPHSRSRNPLQTEMECDRQIGGTHYIANTGTRSFSLSNSWFTLFPCHRLFKYLMFCAPLADSIHSQLVL